MEKMHEVGLYPTDTALLKGVTLLKDKRFLIETSPLSYKKAVAGKDYSFCKVKVLDSVSGRGSTVLKEFTLKNNLEPGNAVILSTEMDDYTIQFSGMHSVQVLVDPENALPEDFKDNNVAELKISVEPFLPDLHFITPDWIYNRGKAPALCKRLVTNTGSISPYKPAFGETTREQAASYSLLLGVVDIVVENNTEWFDGDVVKTAYTQSTIFTDFYPDYEDTEEVRQEVYEQISDNILNRENLNEYLKIMGGEYSLIDGFETKQFCTFGDSTSESSVCSVPMRIEIDKLVPGDFVELDGRPGAFSHPNCLGLEDANPENDLLSGELFTPNNQDAQFLTNLRITAILEDPTCEGVLNIFTSKNGETWYLAQAITIQEEINQVLDFGGLFTYVKIDGTPCIMKSSSVEVVDTNYGDPFTRVNETCGNGIGWSEIAEAGISALGTVDVCFPNIGAHIHDLGGAIDELLPKSEEEVTYLTEELPVESDIEIILQEDFTISAGNTTNITFYVKNNGVLAIDNVLVFAKTDVRAKLRLEPTELSGIAPGNIKSVDVVLQIPWYESGGAHTLEVSVERAGYQLKNAETALDVEMNDNLVMYPIYVIVAMASVGLIFTVLKYTGIHDKIFKRRGAGARGRRGSVRTRGAPDTLIHRTKRKNKK
jgi:archaellum component FlaG (FlaF/FlaG flagellin family)